MDIPDMANKKKPKIQQFPMTSSVFGESVILKKKAIHLVSMKAINRKMLGFLAY